MLLMAEQQEQVAAMMAAGIHSHIRDVAQHDHKWPPTYNNPHNDKAFQLCCRWDRRTAVALSKNREQITHATVSVLVQLCCRHIVYLCLKKELIHFGLRTRYMYE
jgi:hypothetical protein